jgi:ubiquinone/menaquinone biosynthesis C-methylase UbiE
MRLPRGAERLFDFPRLYRAKFAVTGAVLRVVRPLVFTTLVTVDDVVRAAAIAPGSRVLEIGCGDGQNYRAVSVIAGDVAYTGIDINPVMIAHCAEAYPAQRWLVATPPYAFADREFDYCLIINVLHHLNRRGDVVRMLAEARRIAKMVVLFEPLQSEGRLLYALKNAYWALTDGGSRYLRVSEFHAVFAAAGLRTAWERYSAPLRHFYGAHLVHDD